MKISWLPKTWELPHSITSRLGKTVGRQRSMLEEGHLLILLHAPPEPDQEERVPRAFWRQPDGTWRSTLGKGSKALSQHLEEYQARVEEAEKVFSEAAGAEDYFQALERITPLHRAARNMHSAIQQAREFVPDDPELISRRDEAYDIERISELLQADIKHAFDLYLARQTEEMTRSGHRMAVAGHRLNTLVAIFFPTATLAAVLGMNLNSGLEHLQPPWPFVGVLATGIMMGIGVKSWLEHEPDQTPRGRKSAG